MNIISKNFNTSSPIPSIYPDGWQEKLCGYDTVLFDSLDQFVFTVSKLTQKEDSNCNISYADALKNLIQKKSDFPKSDQDTVRNLVRNNLLKRGLITEEVYENFRYTSDGTQLGVDIGKYAAGESDCVLTPSKQYIDFFYELYISISYSFQVSNVTVRNNVAKLLATVEELERKHIFIKINTVLPINNVANIDNTSKNFFSSIPVFSHKDFKSVDVMSSVVNEKLLRKFYFAILENLYGTNLHSGYGYPKDLDKAMNIGKDFNEVELFESIVERVGA
jgi:hypothetical protein